MRVRALAEDIDLLNKDPDSMVSLVDQRTGRTIISFSKDTIVFENGRILLPSITILGPENGVSRG